MNPFDERDVDIIIARGDAIRDMVQKSQGWREVEGIINSMRHSVFTAWTELALDAKPQDAMALRATDKVLRDLMDNIKDAVRAGDEARERKESSQKLGRSEAAFIQAHGTDNAELERLSKPLPPISEAITPS